MKFEHLFKPESFGSLELKNRIVMLPMGTVLCGEWGEVTKELIDWYEANKKIVRTTNSFFGFLFRLEKEGGELCLRKILPNRR